MPENRPAATKTVEIATLILVMLGLLGGAVRFVYVDMPVAKLDQRLRAIEVARAEDESIIVEGKVLSPDLSIEDDKVSVPLHPLIITVKNTGSTRAKLTRIEAAVYLATLADVSSAIVIEPTDQRVRLVAGEEKSATATKLTDRPSLIGILDQRTEKWEKRMEFIIETPGVHLLPGQSYENRQYLLAPPTSSSYLTKIEVTVFTERTSKGWIGLTDSRLYNGSTKLDRPVTSHE